MADPAGKERRQQMGPGEARRTLKTAQEKKLISAKKSWRDTRKIPVRSEELGGQNTNQNSLHHDTKS